MKINPITVNGVSIYPFDSSSQLIDYVKDNKGILVAINAEKILHATEQTREIINRNIGYCDGIGAIMALKKHGCRNVVKIAGCELWLEIIRRLYKTRSFYLIGGKQEVIEATVAKLRTEFEDIDIVNYRNGYISSDSEKEELINDIVTKKPDVVFVAMGSPKQELLMEEIMKRHPAIYQGLGGSFDVYTGNVKRAPKWWIDHNLEFAYRLINQPSRIARQIHLVKFWVMLQLGKL